MSLVHRLTLGWKLEGGASGVVDGEAAVWCVFFFFLFVEGRGGP